MTAINVVRRADAIFVMTDGAAVDAGGVLQDVVQKVLILPYLRAVLAFRGPVELAAAVNLQVAAAFPASFEDLIAALPEAAEEAMSMVKHVRGACEIILAGVSFERQRTEVYFMSTEATSLPALDGSGARRDLAAFELGEAPDQVCSPPPSMNMLAEFGGLPPSLELFNPYLHGIGMMQAQRRVLHSDGRGFYIGGMVNLNTITANGVNSEIVHTWPDTIGEKIMPGGGEQNVFGL